MRIWRSTGKWWHLPLGFIAGVLTVLILAWLTPLDVHAETTQRQQVPISCRQDHSLCPTSARAFVHYYRAGRYGHIRVNHYPAAGRRIILNRAERAWRHLHGSKRGFSRAAMWQRFTGTDSCVSTVINNMVTACLPGQSLDDVVCHDAVDTDPSDRIGVCRWPVSPAWWQHTVNKVVFCGLGLIPLIGTGARLAAIGYGGGLCYAGLSIDF